MTRASLIIALLVSVVATLLVREGKRPAISVPAQFTEDEWASYFYRHAYREACRQALGERGVMLPVIHLPASPVRPAGNSPEIRTWEQGEAIATGGTDGAHCVSQMLAQGGAP